jgi:hypothetical protein
VDFHNSPSSGWFEGYNTNKKAIQYAIPGVWGFMAVTGIDSRASDSRQRRDVGSGNSYAPWQALLDAVGLVLFVLGLSWMLVGAMKSQNSFPLWAIPLIVISALLAADLISGIVHFLADNFGNPETPVFGRLFIFPFREHHVDPLAITRHSFLETNGASCLVSLPLVGLALWATDAEQNALLRLWLFCFLLAVLATNQIHKWAHMARPPFIVRLLQRARLILPPQVHAIHHTPPHDCNYCITTGWLNYPVAKMRIVRARIAGLRGRSPKPHVMGAQRF